MFEIGKKGAADRPETAARADAGPSRADAGGSRGTGSSSREGAIIGPSIHIDGDLRGEEDLVIEGEVNGTVQLQNNSLTIGPKGKVHADVYAHSIYVDGVMEGDLHGAERVHIRKTAQVRGNITSPRVSLEDGAKFKGSIEMDPQASQGARGMSGGKPAAPPKPAAPKFDGAPPKADTASSVKSGAAS